MSRVGCGLIRTKFHVAIKIRISGVLVKEGDIFKRCQPGGNESGKTWFNARLCSSLSHCNQIVFLKVTLRQKGEGTSQNNLTGRLY